MKQAPIRTLIATVCLTTACATMGRAGFREPVVTYKDAVITGLGISGGSLEVVLGVYNPNNFRLDGTRVTYRINIDSVPFGSGTFSDRFSVAEGDTTLIRLPLDFTYGNVGQAGERVIRTGSVPYTISGEITVSTPIGEFVRPYTGRGRFTARR